MDRRKCQCGLELRPNRADNLCPRCVLKQLIRPDTPRLVPAASATPASPAEAPPPGHSTKRFFGEYELLEEIGHGAMGRVYKARQVKLDRIVAVKMILSGQFATPEDIRRFDTEAKAAAKLLHPNIVAVHGVGQHEGQHYYSMDYVEGSSLALRLSENVLPIRQAGRYAQILAEAIEYAHQSHVLHRDLKPGNVLIDANDQPQIIDFGLAKRLDLTDPSLSVTGCGLGTPAYMPPEQIESERGSVGPHSDIYSLGATLYHLLTGRPPFQGTVTEILQQVLHDEPVSPRLLNPSVPRDLETICLACLRKEPKGRYPSAAALAEDLRRWQGGESISMRPVSRPVRIVRWCRREPKLASMAATVFLLLLSTVLLIGALYRQEKAKRIFMQYTFERLQKMLLDRIALDGQKSGRTYLSPDEVSILSGPGLPNRDPETYLVLGSCFAGGAGRLAIPLGQLIPYLSDYLWNTAQLSVGLSVQLYDRQASTETGMQDGSVHLMRANPAVYVRARGHAPYLLPLAQENTRDRNLPRAAIVVLEKSGITNCAGLKGRSFAFGEKYTALGWYLPQRALVQAHLYETNFSQLLSLSSSRVLMAIKRGDLDAGVALLEDIQRSRQLGTRLKVLEELPACPDLVWVAIPQADTSAINALRSALLSLNDTNVLSGLDHRLIGFLPAAASDFDDLEAQMEVAMRFEAVEPKKPEPDRPLTSR